MASTSGYLTLSPSTSTTRSILSEPLDQNPKPLEQIREPLEQNQALSEQSQELQELGLAQENNTRSEETLEQIVEYKKNIIPWHVIAEEVGLPQAACIEIWDDFCHRPLRAIGREHKTWSESEIDLMLRLRRADYRWLEISALLEGRSENSCRLRYRRLCEEAKSKGMDLSLFNLRNWED